MNLALFHSSNKGIRSVTEVKGHNISHRRCTKRKKLKVGILKIWFQIWILWGKWDNKLYFHFLLFFHYQPQILNVRVEIAIFWHSAINWHILHFFTVKSSKYKKMFYNFLFNFSWRFQICKQISKNPILKFCHFIVFNGKSYHLWPPWQTV